MKQWAAARRENYSVWIAWRKSPVLETMKAMLSVEEAWEELQKYEAIVENTLAKYGTVSDALAEKLQHAQIAYAVAKDNRNDPFLKDED